MLLLGYRMEYQQRLRNAIARGVDGAALRNFHQFLDQLEQAIVQQQRTVAASQARTAGAFADDFAGGLVLRGGPRRRGWRMRPSLVQPVNSISATRWGRTQ